MSSAETLPCPEATGWRRVASRPFGICGVALTALLPPVLLIGWPLALGDAALLIANQVLDFTCVGFIVALTLHAWERLVRWPDARRHALLVAGLAGAVVLQLTWGPFDVFHTPGMHERLERAGISNDPSTVGLHLAWFTAILASVSALYLLQRRDSIEAEQRHEALEAQLQQARRRVRILRDTAGGARVDPQVLFDCMGLARREYLRDAAGADALLCRLIDFLRGALSATRSGPHTLGLEVEQALRFAAIPAQLGGLRVVDAIPPELHRLPVSPGLLQPLVQQWLVMQGESAVAADAGGPPLSIHASIQGVTRQVLCLQLNGPAAEPDALLAELRTRLVDLYAGRAVTHAALIGGDSPVLDLRLELPLEPDHVD